MSRRPQCSRLMRLAQEKKFNAKSSFWKNNLEVNWSPKIVKDQEINCGSFNHSAIENKSWKLKLTADDPPSLVLQCLDKKNPVYGNPSNVLQQHVMVTSILDGKLVEQKFNLADKQIQIPIAEHQVEFKLEIRVVQDNFESTVDDFSAQLLNSSEPHDITFKSQDGQVVTAHKVVMAAVSPFVKARFVHDGVQNTVFETDFKADDLKLWIDHIYRRSVISDDTKLVTVMDIFMISDYFGTETVSKLCINLVIDRLSPMSLATVVIHDMIQLSGEQSAKYVLEALYKLAYHMSYTLPDIDQSKPLVVAFMSQAAERNKMEPKRQRRF